MGPFELRPISATRENTLAMVRMRRTMTDAAPLAGWRDEEPLINSPDVQYDSLRHNPGRAIGAFRKNQLLGFMDVGDWLWGHQREFETEFDYLGNTGRPHLLASEELQVEGNPMGILALHADELKSMEFGGPEVVMGELVEEAIDRAGGREIRTPIVAAGSFEGPMYVGNDPARLAVSARGFESAGRTARFGRINYELFIRASQ